jgi:hypothetical protein
VYTCSKIIYNLKSFGLLITRYNRRKDHKYPKQFGKTDFFVVGHVWHVKFFSNNSSQKTTNNNSLGYVAMSESGTPRFGATGTGNTGRPDPTEHSFLFFFPFSV